MTLTLLTLLPFAGALLAAFLPSNARNAEAWLAGLVAVGCTALVASQAPEVAAGGVIRENWAWAPQLGLSISLRMDGFAWLFALLVSLMGALVVLYARYYLSPDDPAPRFFAFLLAFMGAMLGVVLSGNLVQLVVLSVGLLVLAAPLRPLRPRLRRLHLLLPLLATVLVDVARSNVGVARVILGRTGGRPVNSGFLDIPLDLRPARPRHPGGHRHIDARYGLGRPVCRRPHAHPARARPAG